MKITDNKEILGTDLKLQEKGLGSDLLVSATGDLVIVSEEQNLAQAIINRLRTIEGELYEIEHLTYGSRLYDFIGELNNDITRNRIRNYIKSTLLKEPRIKEIVKITVKSLIINHFNNNRNNISNYHRHQIKNNNYMDNKFEVIDETTTFSADNLTKEESAAASAAAASDLYRSLHTVIIDITVIPIDQEIPLNLVFPFYLDIMTEVENVANVQ
jgi:phage baseplate assembly protein W